MLRYSTKSFQRPEREKLMRHSPNVYKTIRVIAAQHAIQQLMHYYTTNMNLAFQFVFCVIHFDIVKIES